VPNLVEHGTRPLIQLYLVHADLLFSTSNIAIYMLLPISSHLGQKKIA
jgi:hypothetical protein